MYKYLANRASETATYALLGVCAVFCLPGLTLADESVPKPQSSAHAISPDDGYVDWDLSAEEFEMAEGIAVDDTLLFGSKSFLYEGDKIQIPIVFKGDPGVLRAANLRFRFPDVAFRLDSVRLGRKLNQSDARIRYEIVSDTEGFGYNYVGLKIRAIRRVHEVLEDLDTLAILSLSVGLSHTLRCQPLALEWCWLKCRDNLLMIDKTIVGATNVIRTRLTHGFTGCFEPTAYIDTVIDYSDTFPSLDGHISRCIQPFRYDGLTLHNNNYFIPCTDQLQIEIADCNNNKIIDKFELERYIDFAINSVEPECYPKADFCILKPLKYGYADNTLERIARQLSGDVPNSPKSCPQPVDTTTIKRSDGIYSVDKPIMALYTAGMRNWPQKVEIIGDEIEVDSSTSCGSFNMLIRAKDGGSIGPGPLFESVFPLDVQPLPRFDGTTDVFVFDFDTADYTVPVNIILNRLDAVVNDSLFPVSISYNGSPRSISGFSFTIAYDSSRLSLFEIYNGLAYASHSVFLEVEQGIDVSIPSDTVPMSGVRVKFRSDTGGPLEIAIDSTNVLLHFFFNTASAQGRDCLWSDVQFRWTSCEDNVLYHLDTTIIERSTYGAPSRDICGRIQNGPLLTVSQEQFPDITGAFSRCFSIDSKLMELPAIEFQNGFFPFLCPDSIDVRDDCNHDGAIDSVDLQCRVEYIMCKEPVRLPPGCADQVTHNDLALLEALINPYVNCPPRVVTSDTVVVTKQLVLPAYNMYVYSLSEPVGVAYFEFADNSLVGKVSTNGFTIQLAKNFVNGATRALVYDPKLRRVGGGQTISADTELLNVLAVTAEGDPVTVLYDFHTDVNADTEPALPTEFGLKQNYPNPFNPSTTIEFALPRSAEWELTVYNLSGQRVRKLNGSDSPGIVSVTVDLNDLASGVYFYKLTAGDFTASRKMVLLK